MMREISLAPPDRFLQFLPDSYVEYLIIEKERSRVMGRAPGKYDAMLSAINLLSNFNPVGRLFPEFPGGIGAFPALEPSYTYGRAIDDVADGDAPVPLPYASFPEMIDVHKALVRSGAYDVPKGLTFEFLLQRMLGKLEKAQQPTDDIREELCQFLDAMRFEYERRINGTVLKKHELEELYAASFGPPLSITLIALGSKARANDLSELGQVQGRIYAIADLKPELARGICNIPHEVLCSSGVTLLDLTEDPSRVERAPSIQAWIREERHAGSVLMQTLMAKIRTLDWKAQLFTKFLLKGVEQKLESNTPAYYSTN